MKRLKRGLGIFCLFAMVTSCESFDPSTVAAIDSSFKVISQDYLDYVEADGSLSEADKANRRNHVQEHSLLIKELAK